MYGMMQGDDSKRVEGLLLAIARGCVDCFEKREHDAICTICKKKLQPKRRYEANTPLLSLIYTLLSSISLSNWHETINARNTNQLSQTRHARKVACAVERVQIPT